MAATIDGGRALRKRQRIRKKRTSGLRFIWVSLSLCLVIGFSLYSSLIEPQWIEINCLQLTLPHLAAEFDRYRIVQISDIHTSRWMNSERLSRIFGLVNEQKPDLIAITGDFATRYQQQFIPNLRATISQLVPKDATVAVLGNHDHWSDPEAVKQVLEQAGIVNLDNTVYTSERGSARLYIAGVDDILVGVDRLDLVLKQLPNNDAAILLAHEPDFADTSAATKRFDLQLSGHSHAGQIRLPFLKPFLLPSLGEKYYAGLYQVGDMILYTNRGIGVSILPLRFNARPEITVFTLVAQARKNKRPV